MFINIATDGIDIYPKNQANSPVISPLHIDKFDVIDSFHHELLKIIHQNYTKNNPLTSMFVIVGPGSFTTLRAGSLVINTLIATKTINPSVFFCNKIDFYQTLINKKILPTSGYIRIGQKKKLWKYDFNNNTKTLENREKINEDNEAFCETVRSTNKVTIMTYNETSLTINYQGQTHKIDINDFDRTKDKRIKPDYMIDAI